MPYPSVRHSELACCRVPASMPSFQATHRHEHCPHTPCILLLSQARPYATRLVLRDQDGLLLSQLPRALTGSPEPRPTFSNCQSMSYTCSTVSDLVPIQLTIQHCQQGLPRLETLVLAFSIDDRCGPCYEILQHFTRIKKADA